MFNFASTIGDEELAFPETLQKVSTIGLKFLFHVSIYI